MRVIHVLRKPLSEKTVASNVLKHGCGGLNIDASRVSGGGGTTRSHQMDYPKTADGKEDRSGSWARTGHGIVETGKGRWPANVILQHLDGCRCDGVKKVKGGNDPRRKDGSKPGHNFHGFDQPVAHDHRACDHTGFGNGDGKETVANWICAEGCPVRDLDGQSGVSTSTGGGMNRSGTGNLVYSKQSGHPKVENVGHGDKGGASRFFKQVGGKTDEAD